MIDGKSLEQEYDPKRGSFGRACSTSPMPIKWGSDWPVDQRPISGITPSDVDLSAYTRLIIGTQDTFPIYAADGGLAAMQMKIWRREQDGHHYCIVFEEFL